MQRQSFVRSLALVALPLLLIVGISLVLAQQLIQPDGRLNQIAHFGGDAFYCVDDNRNPTNQFSDHGATGFRLLNKDGQELWYVSPEVLESVLPNVVRGAHAVLIATGNGTYGETALYVEIQLDGRRFFTFMGYDEHGKTNSLKFEDCTPVGSAVLMETATLPATLTPNGDTATPTNTPGGPTETSTSIPSATNTSDGLPTETSTATSTATGIVPTETSTNTATPTEIVPTETSTNTATPTEIVPTETSTNTATPTEIVPTETSTNTATPTEIVPTATSTNTATPTEGPPPPS